MDSPFECDPELMQEKSMSQPLADLVEEVASLLRATGQRVVFAESCTGGLVSAALARVPGISEFLCGSAVVYRLDTKSKWLDIAAALLLDPGPVSEIVAREMACGVLTHTPEADIAVSITGHLGPNAPADQDGLIFIGVARRQSESCVESVEIVSKRLIVSEGEQPRFVGLSLREQRQWMAVEHVLVQLRRTLS